MYELLPTEVKAARYRLGIGQPRKDIGYRKYKAIF
jgi:hypothetical protein